MFVAVTMDFRLSNITNLPAAKSNSCHWLRSFSIIFSPSHCIINPSSPKLPHCCSLQHKMCLRHRSARPWDLTLLQLAACFEIFTRYLRFFMNKSLGFMTITNKSSIFPIMYKPLCLSNNIRGKKAPCLPVEWLAILIITVKWGKILNLQPSLSKISRKSKVHNLVLDMGWITLPFHVPILVNGTLGPTKFNLT